jgi:hypothetical protein
MNPGKPAAIMSTMVLAAVVVTLPTSAPAQHPADAIIVCSGTNLNCYWAPAGLKLPAACVKGADPYGGHAVFRCPSKTNTLTPPDLSELGPAQGPARRHQK